MKIHFPAAAALLCLVAGAPAIAADCTVFQHGNFGGSQWRLNNHEILAGLDDPGIGSSQTIYWRADWNDQVSSFKVREGCTITMWEHAEGGRIPPRGGGHYFRSNRSY